MHTHIHSSAQNIEFQNDYERNNWEKTGQCEIPFDCAWQWIWIIIKLYQLFNTVVSIQSSYEHGAHGSTCVHTTRYTLHTMAYGICCLFSLFVISLNFRESFYNLWPDWATF